MSLLWCFEGISDYVITFARAAVTNWGIQTKKKTLEQSVCSLQSKTKSLLQKACNQTLNIDAYKGYR